MKSSLTQMVLVSVVCSLCHGIFNAFNVVGGANPSDIKLISTANTAVFSTMAVFSLLGISIVTFLGMRWTLFASGLAYAAYIASFIFFNETKNAALTIVSGSILGIGAGILWSAQNVSIMAYSPSRDHSFCIFWTTFNFASLVGSAVLFAVYFHGGGNFHLPMSTIGHIVLSCLQVLGALCALFLAPVSVVVDSVAHTGQSNTASACTELLEAIKDKWILLLIPLFLTTNFYYAYQWTNTNGLIFTERTRAFNAIIYWASQMFGGLVIKLVYGLQILSRRSRGIMGLTIATITVNAMWGCTLVLYFSFIETPFARNIASGSVSPIDFTQTAQSVAPIFLFCFMGMVDSLWQILTHWLITFTSGDGLSLARYSGLYKCIQSIGAIVAWQLEAQAVSQLTQIIINWALAMFAVPFVLYFILNIKDRSKSKVYPMNFIDIA
ncbi:hypothetical protein BX667DRAFT_473106 [Coemansia mojavensis]|nr:hypothetical protein BX667DRAFT_473106 [Coemansia mojavensis]